MNNTRPAYRDWVIVTCAILIILAIVGTSEFVYLYWIDDNPPVTFANMPFPLDTATYEAGDTIIMTVDYCRYTNAPTVAYRSFHNDVTWFLPISVSSGAPEGCDVINVPISLPKYLPLGKYYLFGRSEYKVNFLMTRRVEWRSVEFEVIARE